jgi:hypothetical protein
LAKVRKELVKASFNAFLWREGEISLETSTKINTNSSGVQTG